MLLTKPQTQRFWREWSAIKRQLKADGSTDAQCENERYAMLQRAGFNSLTEVDTRSGFDRVLAECGAMLDDISRTAEVDDKEIGDRRRMIYCLRKEALPLGGEPYVQAIARDKFRLTAGLHSIEDLTTQQLRQLLITIHARAKKHATKSPTCASPCSSVPVREESVSAPAIASEPAPRACESVSSVSSVPCPVSVEDPF